MFSANGMESAGDMVARLVSGVQAEIEHKEEPSVHEEQFSTKQFSTKVGGGNVAP